VLAVWLPSSKGSGEMVSGIVGPLGVVLLEANALRDYEHHHIHNTDLCMSSFTTVDGSGHIESSGMQLCDCNRGCQSSTHHEESNTFQWGRGDQMISTRIHITDSGQ